MNTGATIRYRCGAGVTVECADRRGIVRVVETDIDENRAKANAIELMRERISWRPDFGPEHAWTITVYRH